MNYMRYTGIVIALTIGLPFVLMLLRNLTGIGLSGTATLIVPVIAAAMITGQRFVILHRRVPTRAETQRFVIIGTLIVIGFQALVTAAVVTNVPGYETLLTAPPPLGLALGGAAFLILVVALCNLFFLRLGARQQTKAGAS